MQTELQEYKKQEFKHTKTKLGISNINLKDFNKLKSEFEKAKIKIDQLEEIKTSFEIMNNCQQNTQYPIPYPQQNMQYQIPYPQYFYSLPYHT
jgi:hypothetical protein